MPRLKVAATPQPCELAYGELTPKAIALRANGLTRFGFWVIIIFKKGVAVWKSRS